MNRREFAFFGLTSLSGLAIGPAHSETAASALLHQVTSNLAQRHAENLAIPLSWVARQFSGHDPVAQRVAAFHLIQHVPYRLTRWTGDPDSLFQGWRGDCRHKAFAQMRLFSALGMPVCHAKVRFDWADLPIPSSILAELPQTLGVHDTVELVLDGQRMIVDPTWDPTLAAAGFPVLAAWDGRSPTPLVTRGEITIAYPDRLPDGVGIYDHLGVPWPNRERTQAFNRAFNAWLNTLRT
ncbi:hypothetical protein [Pelagibius sp.]|uniref:hypothetical protein n=1 Tax=Pelagibius sp. TaxID=1931238 RepID=UPI003BB05780